VLGESGELGGLEREQDDGITDNRAQRGHDVGTRDSVDVREATHAERVHAKTFAPCRRWREHDLFKKRAARNARMSVSSDMAP
jgi:hypothetical protein